MRTRLRLFVLLCCIFCTLNVSGCSEPGAAPLEIYFFDVGQGDAMLLRTEEGDVLIDAGGEQSEALLCLRLEQLGVTELKLAIFTHFDEDHVGGADAVLRNFPAKEIWIGNISTETEASSSMMQAATETGVEPRRVYSGTTFTLGDMHLMVYHPLDKYPADGNEASLVIRMRFGDVTALFMGDAGVEQEKLLMQNNSLGNLSSDLFKLGHHGSDTSTSEAFLQCVKPQYAVISCAAVNLYGHPSGEVLTRLENMGIDTFCTAWQGEIVFESDGKTLQPIEGY